MQQLNPSEISEIIKGRIDKLDVTSQARNEGTVVSVSDGIVRIHGLADVMYGEMIEFPGGVFGGEAPFGLDGFAELAVQGFDRVGIRYEISVTFGSHVGSGF